MPQGTNGDTIPVPSPASHNAASQHAAGMEHSHRSLPYWILTKAWFIVRDVYLGSTYVKPKLEQLSSQPIRLPYARIFNLDSILGIYRLADSGELGVSCLRCQSWL